MLLERKVVAHTSKCAYLLHYKYRTYQKNVHLLILGFIYFEHPRQIFLSVFVYVRYNNDFKPFYFIETTRDVQKVLHFLKLSTSVPECSHAYVLTTSLRQTSCPLQAQTRIKERSSDSKTYQTSSWLAAFCSFVFKKQENSMTI